MNSFAAILDGSLPRECGVSDVFRLRQVHVGEDAIPAAAAWIADEATTQCLILADSRTWKVAGASLMRALEGRSVPVRAHILSDPEGESGPGCDDQTIEEVVKVASGADRLVAVGAGTVNDLVKSAATRLGIPWICVPTAASMNGYTSAIAAVLSKGVKRTIAADQTEAVFADLAIVGDAPLTLNRAGFGDLASKPWSNACWHLAHRITGAGWSAAPGRLLDAPFQELLNVAGGLATGEVRSVGLLLETLLLSGCSMALAGSSSPASGGEHLISHYWDMVAHANHRPVRALHGTQVGVATLLSARLYERVLAVEQVDVEACMAGYPEDREARAAEVRGRHPSLPGSVVEELVEQALGKYLPPPEQRTRLVALQDGWASLCGELSERLLSRSLVSSALAAAGAPTHARDLGVDDATLMETVRVCRDMRSRYTVLDLGADLGILNAFSAVCAEEESP